MSGLVLIIETGKASLATANFDDAVSYFKEAVQIAESDFGVKSEKCISPLVWLGLALGRSNAIEEALKAHLRALAIARTAYATPSSTLAEVLRSVTDSFVSAQRFDEACFYGEEALANYKGAEHTGYDVELTYSALCYIYDRQENWQALALHSRQHLACVEQAQDTTEKQLLMPLYSLGKALTKMGVYAEADIPIRRLLTFQGRDTLQWRQLREELESWLLYAKPASPPQT
jgi:tetratricopeptide (TPR) repeat protein